MELYSLPKHGEIDPTMLIAIFFPIFFGFMLGDIGYGVVTLALFMAMLKIMPAAKNLLKIMIISSVSTILFGVFFGEFFGYKTIFGFPLHSYLDRVEQKTLLLMVAIGIGVIHINVGLLAGFYNELRHHGLMKAILAKLSWLLLQAGVALIAINMLKIAQIPLYVSGAIIAVSIVMIAIGEGIKGILELPAIFGNILSYARLMALGLAGVALAEVINDLAGEMFHAGGFGIVAGVIVLVIGHTINMILGIIGPFLHSMRLHYVEFFTKFYEGGGVPFQAFGSKSNGG